MLNIAKIFSNSGSGVFAEIEESYLPKIKELTEHLDFSQVIKNKTFNTVDMITEYGECTLKGILKVQNISIADCAAKANTMCKFHTHQEKEYLLVYEGLIKLIVGNDTFILKPGDVRYILPNTEHTKYFPEDTKFIAITIPASESFPDCW